MMEGRVQGIVVQLRTGPHTVRERNKEVQRCRTANERLAAPSEPERSRLKYNLLFGGVFALASGFAAHSASAQLSIDLSTGDLAWASGTLEDAPEGRYRWRHVNASRDVRAVECSDIGSLPIVDGDFLVPVGCGSLSWEFRLTPYPDGDAVASEQLSLFAEDPAWWIISEGRALPRRFIDETAPDILFRLDSQSMEILAGPAQMPRIQDAPGFWLLGQVTHIDKGAIRHFVDQRAVPQHVLELLDKHAVGIEYLSSKLPSRVPSPVFWMALSDLTRGIGGIAGTGLILVHYLAVPRDFDKSIHAITLYTVLHEHSHQLLGSLGSKWLDESLASYLAIKSVKETSPPLYPVLFDAFVKPGNALDTPLPILGERAAAGDAHAYSQLYQGAAFWVALDTAMSDEGQRRGLLDVLPRLLAEGFDSDGVPRREMIGNVTKVSEDALNLILDRYLRTGF